MRGPGVLLFLGKRLVGEEPPGEPEDGTGVPAVGLGQRVLVVAADGDDDGGIAGVLEVGRCHGFLSPDFGALRRRG